MSERTIDLHPSWLSHLQSEFDADYMQQLATFLRAEKASGKVVYPPGKQMFAALNYTPMDQVKVVLLGQDPYHGPGQAHGLSFSVPEGQAIPPSLRNIYKELHNDLNITPATHGHLVPWAQQGVLLLNSVLSVQHSQAASHQGKGWERFTDRIVALLNEHTEATVFMLWGSYAQAKGQRIDSTRHLVLRAPHPSPLSAHRGFLGCKHFSKANDYLSAQGKAPIDWTL